MFSYDFIYGATWRLKGSKGDLKKLIGHVNHDLEEMSRAYDYLRELQPLVEGVPSSDEAVEVMDKFLLLDDLEPLDSQWLDLIHPSLDIENLILMVDRYCELRDDEELLTVGMILKGYDRYRSECVSLGGRPLRCTTRF